jgi:hypothetical protein
MREVEWIWSTVSRLCFISAFDFSGAGNFYTVDYEDEWMKGCGEDLWRFHAVIEIKVVGEVKFVRLIVGEVWWSFLKLQYDEGTTRKFEVVFDVSG